MTATHDDSCLLRCDEAEALYLDRAGAELSATEAEALDRHLAGCEACRAFAGDIDDVEDGLEELFGAVARGDLDGNPEAGFLEALPGLTREPAAAPRGRVLRWLVPLGGLAAAAALMVAFGPALGLSFGVATPAPAEVASVASPNPSTLAVVTADAKLDLALADVLAGF